MGIIVVLILVIIVLSEGIYKNDSVKGNRKINKYLIVFFFEIFYV